MPLLASLIFRNGRFFASVGSSTLTALKSLFEEISKILPWSRCPGDPTSAICKVNVDSYKACGRFNGREYSFVRIWWRFNCKLTNGKSPSNETSCISGLLYFLEPWLRCLLLVLSNKFKTFTYWHPGLVRFRMLSMWSLQPYGSAVPSCRIQCSSRFRRKGVLKLGLFVEWYIFSNIRTFMDRKQALEKILKYLPIYLMSVFWCKVFDSRPGKIENRLSILHLLNGTVHSIWRVFLYQ